MRITDSLGAAADPLQDLEATEPGEEDVEQDEREIAAERPGEPCLPVGGDGDRVALRFKALLDEPVIGASSSTTRIRMRAMLVRLRPSPASLRGLSCIASCPNRARPCSSP